MYYNRTRKISKAKVCKPALRIPCPACFYRINNRRYYCRIKAVCGKLCPFSHRTRYYSSAGSAEDKLKKEITAVKIIKIRYHSIVRSTDKSTYIIFSIHHSVTYKYKNHRTNTKIHKIFHNDITCVFRAGKSRLHHGKAALHEKYQNRSQKIPYTHIHFNILHILYLSDPSSKPLGLCGLFSREAKCHSQTGVALHCVKSMIKKKVLTKGLFP